MELNMKKLIIRLASVFLALTMMPGIAIVPVGAANPAMDNFFKVNAYTEGKFSDVASNAWYRDYVSHVYEYGLMKGVSETAFDPEGSMTIASAITISARLNSIFKTGSENFASGTPWYKPYVDYAKSQCILKSDFSDYNKAITRREFAVLLSAALDKSAYKMINDISDNSIPDVKSTDNGAEEIYLLYRAGIMLGSDSSHSFLPDSQIKRSEAAAVIARIIISELRLNADISKKTVNGKEYTVKSVIEFSGAGIKASDDRETIEFLSDNDAVVAKIKPNPASDAYNKSTHAICGEVYDLGKFEITTEKYPYAEVEYYYEVCDGHSPSAYYMNIRPYASRKWLGLIQSSKLVVNKWDTASFFTGGLIVNDEEAWSKLQLQTFGGNHGAAVGENETMYIKSLKFYEFEDYTRDVNTEIVSEIVEIPEVPTVAEPFEFTEATPEILKQYSDAAEALKGEIQNSPNGTETLGTVYYVSQSGNDTNTGLSPDKAWQTLERANAANSNATILFERGGTYRGTLKVKSNMIYGAYGEGEKPVIMASTDASGESTWRSTQYENVYECVLPFNSSVGNMVFDNGRAYGIQKLAGVTNAGIDGIFNNGIESYDATHYVAVPSDLKYNLEFFLDEENAKLYLCSTAGNPGKVFKSIEVCTKVSAAGAVSSLSSNIILENIHFANAGVHGIGLGSVENVTVRFCEFSFIGGAVSSGTTRLGNAVESFGSSKNFTVHDNYAYQIYDCGFTNQWQGQGKDAPLEGIIASASVFYNNISEKANNCLEFWIRENGTPSGKEFAFKDCYAWNNYSIDNGYGFGQSRELPSSSMFYGNLCGTTTKFINFNVYDNVMINSSKYALFVYKLANESGFIMKNNVYIHEYGKDFASVFYVPYKYDRKTIETMRSGGMIFDSKFYYTLPEGKTLEDIEDNQEFILQYDGLLQKGDDRQTVERAVLDNIGCAKLVPNYESENAGNAAYKIHYFANNSIRLAGLSSDKYAHVEIDYYYKVPVGQTPCADKVLLRPYSLSKKNWLGFIEGTGLETNKWSKLTIDMKNATFTDTDVWSMFQLQVFGGNHAAAIPAGEEFYIASMRFYN